MRRMTGSPELCFFAWKAPEGDLTSPTNRLKYAQLISDKYQGGTDTQLLNTSKSLGLIYDKCPDYEQTIRYTRALPAASYLLPSAKIVYMVCDPIKRLWSRFHHNLMIDPEGVPAKSFPELLDLLVPQSSSSEQQYGSIPDSPPYVHYSVWADYIGAGYYYHNIATWAAAYGHDKIHTIYLSDLKRDNQALRETTIRKLLNFLQLPPAKYNWKTERSQTNIQNQNHEAKGYCRDCIPEDFVQRLQPVFKVANQDLARYLNASFPLEWNGEKPPER